MKPKFAKQLLNEAEASFGTASFPSDAHEADKLISKAQHRLQRAQGGRHAAFGHSQRDIIEDGRLAEALDDVGKRDHLLASSMPP